MNPLIEALAGVLILAGFAAALVALVVTAILDLT